MESPWHKVKPLSKEETKALLGFIQKSHIINNKKTNAASNKMKIDEWNRIADTFNATVATCRRTPQQLRLKWENLKKNCRKRNSAHRKINIKTIEGTDYITQDEILDTVTSILHSGVDGFTDKYGADSKPILLVNDGSSASTSSDDLKFLPDNQTLLPDNTEVLSEAKIPGGSPKSISLTSATPRATGLNQKLTNQNQNRAARDLAIAEYFHTKKKYMEEIMAIQKEYLKIKTDKLKLEVEKLNNVL